MYVIYTSGTTGNPKGVLIEHKNVVRLLFNDAFQFDFASEDVWTMFHNYNFDFSVWEMYGALMYGGKLIIVSSEVAKDTLSFAEMLTAEGVTILNQTPSAFYNLSEIFRTNHSNNVHHIRYVIFGGEALQPSKLDWWHQQYPTTKLVNMYGITETTVHVTYQEIGSREIARGISSIGKPIPTLSCYILDEQKQLCAVGQEGELYVGGLGVARGYLNREELTKEKFITNPYNPTERLYRTGDLGRWREDGNLEYLGRMDDQVKIRGYRIELGEIESMLMTHPKITNSVVLAKFHSHKSKLDLDEKNLVAYYSINKSAQKNQEFSCLLDNWNHVYEETYKNAVDLLDYRHNFIGWNSSYTGHPISRAEMLEWLKGTINCIQSLNPKVIFEIGSGSGLLLFNLIEDLEYYFGSDFSESVIRQTQNIIDKLHIKNKVQLHCSMADMLPFNRIDRQCDTIILNSIVQYFPNLEYLTKVVDEVIKQIPGIKTIFIGDVRDYRLLECFHYSILKFKKSKHSNLADIINASSKENELLISPEYFLNYKSKNESIQSVEIMPKIEDGNRELSCYRYDVFLHMNQVNKKDVLLINEDEFETVFNFQEYVENHSEKECLFINYKNYRIYEEFQGYAYFKKYNQIIENKELADVLSFKDIIDYARLFGYSSKFYLDIKRVDYVNIILCKKDLEFISKVHFSAQEPSNFPKDYYANNPSLQSEIIDGVFSKELKQYLESLLPHYMVPNYYVKLESIPLTSNGKVDRKSLPDPEGTGMQQATYIAPSTETEKKLVKIWTEVLGVEEETISIKAD